jgi:hypothetical protein
VYNFVWNTSERDIGLYVKYLLFLYYFKETRISLTDYRKIFKYQSSSKFLQWESNFFYADGQIELKKLVVNFRNFGKAPKNYSIIK